MVGKGSEFELVLPFSMPAAEVAATWSGMSMEDVLP